MLYKLYKYGKFAHLALGYHKRALYDHTNSVTVSYHGSELDLCMCSKLVAM